MSSVVIVLRCAILVLGVYGICVYVRHIRTDIRNKQWKSLLYDVAILLLVMLLCYEWMEIDTLSEDIDKYMSLFT